MVGLITGNNHVVKSLQSQSEYRVLTEPRVGCDSSNQVNIMFLFEDAGEETKLTMLIIHDSTEQKEMNEQGGMLMVFKMTRYSFAEFVATQTA